MPVSDIEALIFNETQLFNLVMTQYIIRSRSEYITYNFKERPTDYDDPAIEGKKLLLLWTGILFYKTFDISTSIRSHPPMTSNSRVVL